MIFKDMEHERIYKEICDKMHYLDCYRKCVAYLIALDRVTREHINDLYDFEENCIKISGLHKEWQTGTSKKTTRLAFNLWNGLCADEGLECDSSSRYYAVDEIFCFSEYAQYYFYAIQIRFEY